MVGAVVLVAVVRADGVLDVVAADLVAAEPAADDPAGAAGAADVPAGAAGVADVAAAPLPAAFCAAPFFPEPLTAKKSRQMGSTLCGSARNC